MGCDLEGLRKVLNALIGYWSQSIREQLENLSSWSIEASKDAFPFVSIIHLGFGQNRFGQHNKTTLP